MRREGDAPATFVRNDNDPFTAEKISAKMRNVQAKVGEKAHKVTEVIQSGMREHEARRGFLNSNVTVGEGEENQSYGDAIRLHKLPTVAIFPAHSKTGLATLRSLTSYPNRNACAKIVCIVREENCIPIIRHELNEHLTDSVTFSFADYRDVKNMATAFMGVDRLFLIPPVKENREELTINGIDAAKLAGIPHVVLMSAVLAQHPNTKFGKQFRGMEEHLESMQKHFNYTVLRSAWFMDNFLDMSADIVSNNRFLSSWGPSSVAAVSLADVGRSAAAIMCSPKDSTNHIGRTYHITGPESLSGFRMAEILSKELGRNISYQDLPREEMRKVYVDGMQMEQWSADGILEMNDLFKSGAGAAFSTDVAMLTRGNHTTFERFIRNKRWYFAGQRSPLICILPSSGRVGTNTLSSLMRDNSQGRIRSVVRNEDHKRNLERMFGNATRLEIVIGDIEQTETIRAALQGVDTLLIIPPEKMERFSLIDETIKIAYDAGVSHTILFSVTKSLDSTAIGKKFHAWERVLEKHSHSFTIIRSSLFQDLMFYFAEQITKPEHKVHHWLGNGRFCPVDSRDVGDACAAVLREGPIEHHAHIYSLNGPQVLSFSEMVAILSKVLGYHIEAVPDITSDQVRATLEDKLPSFNVEEVVQAHECVANGNDTMMTPDLIKLTGQSRTVQAFFEDNADHFDFRGYLGKGLVQVDVTKTYLVSGSTVSEPRTHVEVKGDPDIVAGIRKEDYAEEKAEERMYEKQEHKADVSAQTEAPKQEETYAQQPQQTTTVEEKPYEPMPQVQQTMQEKPYEGQPQTTETSAYGQEQQPQQEAPKVSVVTEVEYKQEEAMEKRPPEAIKSTVQEETTEQAIQS